MTVDVSSKTYTGRKFALSVFASVCSAAGLFLHYLTGGEWIAAQTLILGLYKAADVAEKVFVNANPSEPA
jgi:hypothetical protein